MRFRNYPAVLGNGPNAGEDLFAENFRRDMPKVRGNNIISTTKKRETDILVSSTSSQAIGAAGKRKCGFLQRYGRYFSPGATSVDVPDSPEDYSQDNQIEI